MNNHPLPLSALLSHLLVAFTIEFDNLRKLLERMVGVPTTQTLCLCSKG